MLTYLAQKDFSGGFTPSPSPFSPPRISSAKAGALQEQTMSFAVTENCKYIKSNNIS